MFIVKEASVVDKLLGRLAILVAIFLIFAVLVYFTDYLPSQEYFNIAKYIIFGIAIGYTAFLFFIIYQNIKSVNKKESFMEAIITLSILLIVGVYFSIAYSLPFLLHKIVSTEYVAESFIVDSKYSEYYKRRPKCNGGVYLRYDVFIHNKICGVPREIWRQLSSGDSIVLVGKKSYFGFSYNSFRINN